MSSPSKKDRKNTLPDWHVLTAEKVLEDLSSSTRGLTVDEVARRRQQYGPNRLPAPPRRNPLIQFLHQFNNVLIYVLICAAAVTAILAG